MCMDQHRIAALIPSVWLGNCLQLFTQNNFKELVKEESFTTCAGIPNKDTAESFIRVIL